MDNGFWYKWETYANLTRNFMELGVLSTVFTILIVIITLERAKLY